VRSVEEYGIFIELTPNLAGLAEYDPTVKNGECASVYIKSINRQKMKIKLVTVDHFSCDNEPAEPIYFFEGSHIDRFCYSPDECDKKMETVF
jgi:small subunit ribosomal protein S1